MVMQQHSIIINLLKNILRVPQRHLKESQLDNITASGPPLEVLLDSLEKLRDRRAAANRDDIRTRFDDIQILKKTLGKE